ncbi:MAG TPA: ORF6N domain-containing protein [Chthoniobacterales bacterium]|nr:ORF6N domain-containing protein [Chthoniobacterales bacterium]
MSQELIPVARIAQSILYLRGQKTILDSELSALYGVATKVLNQAVKRNAARFPGDFMFQLTAEESRSLRSQFVTLKQGKHFTYRPYAFTEQGVAMLSSVLKSERAVKVNIVIMRAFVKLRETIETNRELARRFAELERRVGQHDEKIGAILEAIRQLMAPPQKPAREIGFHVREKAPPYRARNHR